jgi:hypothetical protein
MVILRASFASDFKASNPLFFHRPSILVFSHKISPTRQDKHFQETQSDPSQCLAPAVVVQLQPALQAHPLVPPPLLLHRAPWQTSSSNAPCRPPPSRLLLKPVLSRGARVCSGRWLVRLRKSLLSTVRWLEEKKPLFPPPPGVFNSDGNPLTVCYSGVAVGSSIGHAIGGFFGGGGGSSQAAEQAPAQTDAYAQPMDNGLYNSQNQAAYGANAAADNQPCAMDAKNFTRCMDENRGDMTICGWYLEQLKNCQVAARPY